MPQLIILRITSLHKQNMRLISRLPSVSVMLGRQWAVVTYLHADNKEAAIQFSGEEGGGGVFSN